MWVDWLEASGRMSHDYLWSGALDEDQVITYVRACAACVRACVDPHLHTQGRSVSHVPGTPPIQVHPRDSAHLAPLQTFLLGGSRIQTALITPLIAELINVSQGWRKSTTLWLNPVIMRVNERFSSVTITFELASSFLFRRDVSLAYLALVNCLYILR